MITENLARPAQDLRELCHVMLCHVSEGKSSKLFTLATSPEPALR